MDFSSLCQKSRTYRRFTKDPIEPSILKEIIENVRIANSAMNAQVLRYAVVTTPTLVSQMHPLIHWAAALPKDLGAPKEGQTPTAFILISTLGRGNAWSDIDIGIAARTINLNAMAHGIGSAMLGAVDFKKAASLLDLPEDWRPRLLIALGYPAVKSHLVSAKEGDPLKYYLDEHGDFVVPKLSLDTICIFK